jgi:LmbE family N-acetylglucosaminyl deacetylase
MNHGQWTIPRVLARVRNFVRRRVRAIQRGGQFPLLLPHHTIVDGSLRSVDGSSRAVSPALAKALGRCDGRRTLAQVANEAGVGRAELIGAHDEGLVLFWHRAVTNSAEEAAGPHPHGVILSPHLDDAALSCGGRMLGDRSMLVVNVFSRAAWWRFAHEPLRDEAKIRACRLAEEELVGRLSGCGQRRLDLPEALLRGYTMAELFTAAEGEQDREVSVRIGEAVEEMARGHPAVHWYLPLGVGGHIDHRLVRDAGRAALERAGVKPAHVHFYEDQPYAARPEHAADGDWSAMIPGVTLREDALGIEDVLAWKLEMLRAYWSQFRWSELVELKRYATEAGGGEAVEVVWNLA